MKHHMVWTAAALAISFSPACPAAIETVIAHNGAASANPEFTFKDAPQPSKNDAGTQATFVLIDGRRDGNGGGLEKLHDGLIPVSEDQPVENFFFAAGTSGGRLLIDLGKAITIRQVNTYSWHANTRGPQVYQLYASDGPSEGFVERPTHGTDPTSQGWKAIASVDTRPKSGSMGGQYAVSVRDTAGALGAYRYLLFDISPTERTDPFGNTFFSEIDVVSDTPDKAMVATPAGGRRAQTGDADAGVEVVEMEEGKFQVVIDTTDAPDLTEWARKELAPVVRKWYPKLVSMLPSDGYEAPTRVRIEFSESMRGVAATGGSLIRCAASWFRRELTGEAKGAVVHELVHVVQNYGRARRTNPNPSRTPGWLVEGIPDYIRWFLYEPHTRGAEITSRNLAQANYDGSYRISGNFIDWVTRTHDKNIVRKLNAAAREGRYQDALWEEYTGLSLPKLNDAWKEAMKQKVAEDAKHNTLTEEEKAAGWQLLFNGKTLDGWSNFKRDDIRPGWQARQDALVCVDPHNAGDLCTKESFDWFELKLEYNISPAGNSGIIFHATDEGGAVWATGPEFQLEDNAEASDPVRCGWLYGLYQPPIDPTTGKTLDATQPAGQWNQVRLLVSPEKCVHEINGVKYFEYVLGSDDFKERVAKSKFGRMPLFAKSNKGYIALQGDHGQIAFRNIKLRPIKTGE